MQEEQKPRRLSFGRSRRISGRDGFRKVFSAGKTVRGEWMTLKILPCSSGTARFACAVSKKIAPTAVQRNKIRRWLKEAFRKNQEQFPSGIDLIAVVVKIPERGSYQKTEQMLLQLVKPWSQK